MGFGGGRIRDGRKTGTWVLEYSVYINTLQIIFKYGVLGPGR